MKKQYTPTPWYYTFFPLSGVSPNGQFTIKAGEVGTPIALLPLPQGGGERGISRQEANARLIAAAPDLLEALEQCVEALKVVSSFEATKPIIDRATMAINKAYGK